MRRFTALLLLAFVLVPRSLQAFTLPWHHPYADLTFESFYGSKFGVNWYLVAGGAVVAAGVIVVTGGTATPGIVITIGTWVGNAAGLSGIAATNYGLALIGGGAVASGGLGIVGGSAILAATFSVVGDVAFDVAAQKAMRSLDNTAFLTATRTMLTLPNPRNDSGGDSYRKVLERVTDHYYDDRPYYDELNQAILNDGLAFGTSLADTTNLKSADLQRLESYLALLFLNSGNPSAAQTWALRALSSYLRGVRQENDELADLPSGSVIESLLSPRVVDATDKPPTLPLAIWAFAELAAPSPRLDLSTRVVQTVLLQEGDAKVVPLLVSAYSARLLLRLADLRPTHLRDIFEAVSDNVHESRLRHPALETLLVRSLSLARVNRDVMTNLTELPGLASLLRVSPRAFGQTSWDDVDKYVGLCGAIMERLETDENFMGGEGNRQRLQELRNQVRRIADEQSALKRKVEELK